MQNKIIFDLELCQLPELSTTLIQHFDDYCVVGLTGDLGAGKTTFSKSLIKSLGIQDEVTSPTYAIENEYYNAGTQILVRHLDLYRGLENFEINEIFEKRNISGREVVIIEWANLLRSSPKTNYLELNFNVFEGAVENVRKIGLTGNIGSFSTLGREIHLKYGKKRGI